MFRLNRRDEPPDPPDGADSRFTDVARRSTGWGYVMAWSLGIGVGAVAAGAFVGFLINGPPGHAARDRIIADVAPPTPDVPPPTAQEIIASKAASAALVQPTPPVATVTPISAPAPTTTASMPLPPIPPAKPSAPLSTPLSMGDMREMQGRLQSLGFDPGPLDGSAGPRTTAAIARYQRAHGLAETGVADKDMLDGLRHEPGSTAPPPPPRPRPQGYQYAAAAPPPRQSNPFTDAINRLFGR